MSNGSETLYPDDCASDARTDATLGSAHFFILSHNGGYNPMRSSNSQPSPLLAQWMQNVLRHEFANCGRIFFKLVLIWLIFPLFC